MHPILVELGSIKVGTYGAAAAAAVLLGTWIAMKAGERTGIAATPEEGRDVAIDLVLFHILGLVVGAKLLQIFSEWDRFSANPAEIFNFREMGVFYGGLIGSLIAVTARAVHKRIDPWKAWDTLAPAFALSHGITRVGCLLAGCCFGQPTDSWLGFSFPKGSVAYDGVQLHDAALVDGAHTVPLLPVQLFETIGEFAIGAVLLAMLLQKARPGWMIIGYLFLYAPLRFALETYRFDLERGFVGVLSTSQLISLAMFALAIGLAAVRLRQGVRPFPRGSER